MSVIHVTRIEKKLDETYSGKILLDDHEKASDSVKRNSFLSRAQAAIVLSHFAEISVEASASSITDGYDDNGIDAIYVDDVYKNLYVVQSKWVNKGNKGVDLGDSLKFLKGFKDLMNAEFSKFNDRINKKKDEIEKAISNAEFSITIILAVTSNQGIPKEFRDELEELISQFNDSSEILSFELYDQKRIYQAILVGAEGEPINLEGVTLYNWGKHDNPYNSYYGEIDVSSVGEWWNSYGTRLFSKNIRKFKGNTEVNDGIRQTLLNNPEDFWYFNNGITILCSKIKKGAKAATDRQVGIFNFYGVSVVNGAQTIGSIGGTVKQSTESIQAKAQIRFIDLESAPEEYAQKITRYNNTQNKIENKDFIALDPNQERIKKELWLENKLYTYKSGEKIPVGNEGCDVEEATIALACAHSNIVYAVQAKNEIGKLWIDIQRPPYRYFFNASTTGIKVYFSIEGSRKCSFN